MKIVNLPPYIFNSSQVSNNIKYKQKGLSVSNNQVAVSFVKGNVFTGSYGIYGQSRTNKYISTGEKE